MDGIIGIRRTGILGHARAGGGARLRDIIFFKEQLKNYKKSIIFECIY